MVTRQLEQKTIPLQWVARIGIPLISFAGGALFNAYTIASNLATKPYVDQAKKEAMSYTDQQVQNALREAINHSDMNREFMATKLEGISAKQDMFMELLKEIKRGR